MAWYDFNWTSSPTMCCSQRVNGQDPLPRMTVQNLLMQAKLMGGAQSIIEPYGGFIQIGIDYLVRIITLQTLQKASLLLQETKRIFRYCCNALNLGTHPEERFGMALKSYTTDYRVTRSLIPLCRKASYLCSSSLKFVRGD